MHDPGCLGLVHQMTQEGWYGEGEEEGFRIEATCMPVAVHVDVWQAQYNIVKSLTSNQNK